LPAVTIGAAFLQRWDRSMTVPTVTVRSTKEKETRSHKFGPFHATRETLPPMMRVVSRRWLEFEGGVIS
jgi:hypothetical protein